MPYVVYACEICDNLEEENNERIKCRLQLATSKLEWCRNFVVDSEEITRIFRVKS